MAVRAMQGGGSGASDASDSRPLGRKLKLPRSKDGKTIVTDLPKPPDEGYKPDGDIPDLDFEELYRNRMARKGFEKSSENQKKVLAYIETKRGSTMPRPGEEIQEELEETNTEVEIGEDIEEELVPKRKPTTNIPKPQIHQTVHSSNQTQSGSNSYEDGILHLVSDGTEQGTFVTLNGQKLDVKVVFSLNFIR